MSNETDDGFYLIGTPGSMAAGSNMVKLEPPPIEPTGARLTDADIAELQRCVKRSGKYADEWLISPDDVAALLADRAALVAEVHGWRQVAEEERRTREIAQERYGNALGEQSALEAQIAAMRPLVEALAGIVDINIDDSLVCASCEGLLGPGRTHAPDCAKMQARALAATWQTEPQKGDDIHGDEN